MADRTNQAHPPSAQPPQQPQFLPRGQVDGGNVFPSGQSKPVPSYGELNGPKPPAPVSVPTNHPQGQWIGAQFSQSNNGVNGLNMQNLSAANMNNQPRPQTSNYTGLRPPGGQPPPARPPGLFPPTSLPPSQTPGSFINGPGNIPQPSGPHGPPGSSYPRIPGPGVVPPQASRPPLGPPGSFGQPNTQPGGLPTNGSSQPPITGSFQQVGNSAQLALPEGRPNELPVPFHGQGQYSHQVNPLMQKTPTQTPSNSEPPSQKSSRGSSPVSGSTIDALEGQFTPGHGTPPTFPASQGGSATPPRPGNNYTPPLQGVSQSQPGTQNPQAPPPKFGMAPRPGFPPPSVGVPTSGGFPKPSMGGGIPPSAPASSSSATPPLAFNNQVSRFPPSGPPLSSQVPGFPPSSSAPGQTSRFPPPPSSSGQVPGFAPPSSTPNQIPRYSSPSSTPSQVPGFPPPSSTPGQIPGFRPPPSGQVPGFPPPPSSNQTAGFPPPPTVNQSQGFPPHPPSSQMAGFPPPPQGGAYSQPPVSSAPGFPSPNMPPTSQMMGQRGPAPPSSQYSSMLPGQPSQSYGQPGPPTSVPGQMGAYPSNVNAMSQNFGQMGLQDTQRALNLLNERHLISPEGVETPKPNFQHDFKKVNCSPDVFRCTLNAIPNTSALLNKARLPLGILIHPFRDLSQLPVIQSSVIVRCRSCRTYINPFVVFVDQRRWKCNLCFRVNDLPEEFSFDPVSKTYGDPQRRPEVKSATIEFIAPSEYMLRPPQPAVYLFLLDVSFNAVQTGYLSQFCQILLDELDKLPGDARTTIGFLCYDRALYYFNLAEGLSQPQMLCVPDLEDPFLPCPDNLLVNLHESKELVTDLLNQLPSLFEKNVESGNALGAALQSALKLMSATGGRITVMQTCLPTVGPGALQNRDDPSGNSGKNVANIGPATDFYKKLSLDCSAQQIAVDLFVLNKQYADIASLSCISKYSAGSVYHYPSFNTVTNQLLIDKFDTDLRRYLCRKIGFESVMRIRCTRGLSIHTFHGNFFVRSTDLLSLPNINPDAGFGMQMSIEDNLNESSNVSFQAALLYTSSKGERRIRVHTLCVPVTNQLSEVFAAVDQQAVAALLAKMAVDRSLNSAIGDARDAMINAALDSLQAYSQQVPASQRVGALLAPRSLRLLPMYMLAMLKSDAFNLHDKTKLDDRVFAMQQYKVQPVCYLVQNLYPHLYPLHRVSEETPIIRGKEEIPAAPLLQLSSANIDRTGMFLMDTGESMYILVGSGISDQLCQDAFGKSCFKLIPDDMMDLPELDNPVSERIRRFINHLMDSRPHGVSFLIIRDDGKNRFQFFRYMLEDRTENSMSYHEFLQFLQGKAKG